MLYSVLTLTILVILFVRGMQKPARFPPGPPKLPIIGSIPFLMATGKIGRGIREAVEKYGPVMGFFRGPTPVVIISDFDILKRVFKRDEFAARPPQRPLNEIRPSHDFADLNGTLPGILFAQGKSWAEQRKFVVRTLRDFGFGKKSMEDIIQLEVDKLIDVYMKKHIGKPFHMAHTMHFSIINSLWYLMLGECLDPEDPKQQRICDVIKEAATTKPPVGIIVQMLPHPSMAKWPIIREFSGYRQWSEMMKESMSYIVPKVKEHQATLDVSSPRDFLDAVLIHVKETEDPKSSFFGQRGYDSAINLLTDMFLAGMETTSNTINFAVYYILQRPEVQIKIHEEIDRVLGKTRSACLDDMETLPYCNAVMHEALRYTSLAGLAIRYVEKQDYIEGYTIPGGSFAIGNLTYIMRDEYNFKDPDTFKPERFIDPATGAFVPNEKVIPFSVGKRYCPGQTLAEKEYFLFFVRLFQNFTFKNKPGQVLPPFDKDGQVSVTMPLPYYEVILESRI